MEGVHFVLAVDPQRWLCIGWRRGSKGGGGMDSSSKEASQPQGALAHPSLETVGD